MVFGSAWRAPCVEADQAECFVGDSVGAPPFKRTYQSTRRKVCRPEPGPLSPRASAT